MSDQHVTELAANAQAVFASCPVEIRLGVLALAILVVSELWRHIGDAAADPSS